MALIVQKFGGDALGDKGKGRAHGVEEELYGAKFLAEKFEEMARLVVRRVEAGDKVVAVVSAMGDATNRMIKMARKLTPTPAARELDMLMTTGEQQAIALAAIAIQAAGGKALSLTGPQVGIVTDEVFGQSRIKEIKGSRVKAALAEGMVPVIAGFQGATVDNEITTLGRGGSDITAVAVAAAIQADACEFYKDVDGIFTTDPRICPEARKIDRISYDEMLELASLGAGVLHSRSVEFAKRYGVPLHVRSYLHDGPGTIVTHEEKEMEDIVVSGVAFNRDEAKLTLLGVPDHPGVASRVFSRIGDAGIVVDMIIQSEAQGGSNDISFTVGRSDYQKARAICEEIAKDLGAAGVKGDATMAKVSAVGIGMKSHSGVASKMFSALAIAGINIQMISTSEIKISCVVSEKDLEAAVRAIHKAFEDQPAMAGR